MWIDLVKDVTKIWTQNSMAGGTDRASTVRSLIRGESLTAFEAALDTARTTDGVVAALTPEHVTTAMNAVAETVFPHRALEIQKLWMNRSMYKPRALTTRMTSAAVSRINNALPMFPNGVETSKFSEEELVVLLEWSLPPAWREKFDLKGYIPTQHNRTRLIAECEAIERHVKTDDPPKSTTTTTKKKKKEITSSAHSKSERPNKYFCSEHGNNPSHNTSDCYVLKNRANSGSKGSSSQNNRSFSNKNFRKELHMLSKKSSKKKVLDMYESVIKKEQSKLAKRKAKRKQSEPASDSDSDTAVSLGNLEPDNRKKRSKSKKLSSHKKPTLKKTKKTSKQPSEETMAEENASYNNKVVKWCKDRGDSDADEPMEESESE